MSALINFGEPLIFVSAIRINARVHLFARRVDWAADVGRQQAKAARLDAAIAANLKEFGYGG